MAFLVTPIDWILGGIAFSSTVDGQRLSLAGPPGPLSVEIGVACSGLQAMARFLGILGLFAVTVRPTNRRRAAWAASGLLGRRGSLQHTANPRAGIQTSPAVPLSFPGPVEHPS